MNISVTPMYTK